jgi:hypothetical protein
VFAPPKGQDVAIRPAVMLSPKATIFVAFSWGVLVTLTLKVQEAVRRSASRAVHMTLVEPTAKDDPLRGVHVVVTGAVPPLTIGDG